jgi:hypothetical protein
MTAAETLTAFHAEHCNPAEIAAYLQTTERAVRADLAELGLADGGAYRYVDAVVSGRRK